MKWIQFRNELVLHVSLGKGVSSKLNMLSVYMNLVSVMNLPFSLLSSDTRKIGAALPRQGRLGQSLTAYRKFSSDMARKHGDSTALLAVYTN